VGNRTVESKTNNLGTEGVNIRDGKEPGRLSEERGFSREGRKEAGPARTLLGRLYGGGPAEVTGQNGGQLSEQIGRAGRHFLAAGSQLGPRALLKDVLKLDEVERVTVEMPLGLVGEDGICAPDHQRTRRL